MLLSLDNWNQLSKCSLSLPYIYFIQYHVSKTEKKNDPLKNNITSVLLWASKEAQQIQVHGKQAFLEELFDTNTNNFCNSKGKGTELELSFRWGGWFSNGDTPGLLCSILIIRQNFRKLKALVTNDPSCLNHKWLPIWWHWAQASQNGTQVYQFISGNGFLSQWHCGES